MACSGGLWCLLTAPMLLQRVQPAAHDAMPAAFLCKACAVACRVGDLIKFGQSTRLCLLWGPEELLPDEGLNREQRRQQAAMKVQLVTYHSACSLVSQDFVPIAGSGQQSRSCS